MTRIPPGPSPAAHDEIEPPIVGDLVTAGYDVASVGDLRQTYATHPEAISFSSDGSRLHRQATHEHFDQLNVLPRPVIRSGPCPRDGRGRDGRRLPD